MGWQRISTSRILSFVRSKGNQICFQSESYHSFKPQEAQRKFDNGGYSWLLGDIIT